MIEVLLEVELTEKRQADYFDIAAELRPLTGHRAVLTSGRGVAFRDYRLKVAHVLRDHRLDDRLIEATIL
ncbi:MAG: hypothetical protein GY717_05160 [Rhodobacteraceae bacterium]|nr:hypothetical protein [Paracoccaceae bacterium]